MYCMCIEMLVLSCFPYLFSPRKNSLEGISHAPLGPKLTLFLMIAVVSASEAHVHVNAISPVTTDIILHVNDFILLLLLCREM